MIEGAPDAVVAQVKANIDEQLADSGRKLAELIKGQVVANLPEDMRELLEATGELDRLVDISAIDVSALVQVAPIVTTILAAQQEVAEADPVDTIRMSDEGATARRVMDPNGRTYWVVTQRSGGTYEDLSPTLPWPVVYTPPEQP